ncbi:ubiquitin carboxyl-terminal hydrolase 16, partial [Aplochiton taeniatus]
EEPPVKDLSEENGQEAEPPTIWACLKCGHIGCGRNSEHQHAIKHYEKPRSDPHCLVVNMDNWSVWCYICDDDVQYSKTGHLAQLVTNLKKQALSEPRTQAPPRKVKVEDKPSEEEPVNETPETQDTKTPPVNSIQRSEPVKTEEKENQERQTKKGTKKEIGLKGQKSPATGSSSGVSVKGLSNLGNTCFFNAVVQNLAQTPLLKQILNKVTEEKTSLTVTPAVSSLLEPIRVQLDQPGSLTLAMAQLLYEIQQTKKGVVTPRELFSQVCKKAPRFKGFAQQDSQELLRYLLDGMRAEEMKRVSTGILEAMKKDSKSTDAEQSKTILKEYERNGVPRNFVDQVFGGELTSTVMCQQCKTVSLVTETFLDLSLPVSDEAYRKKNPKKAVVKNGSESSEDGRDSPVTTPGKSDMPTGVGSKYQQKKAKKQAKKQAKNQRRQEKLGGKKTLDMFAAEESPESGQNDALEADSREDAETCPPADVTSEGDPVGTDAPAENRGEPDVVQPGGRKEEEEEKEGDESCSVGDGEPSAASAASNRFTALSEDQNSESSVSEDKDPSQVGQGEEGDTQPSKPAKKEEEEEEELTGKMEDMSLNEAFIASDAEDQDAMQIGDGQTEAKEYTVVNQDPELAFRTLATRAAPEKQECSVQSCLFQFTEVEKLCQNNRLLCVTCTKRQPSVNTSEGIEQSVYTDALKQMLISSPPPVLTLHLKRFQQIGYSVCKMNRHVQFPQILDIAPFCAATCKNVAEGDSQVLYRLYGIVEHSGTMRSGHYTAYVKSRPESPTANGVTEEGEVEPSRGSWFHASDTSIHPVTESKAQSSQAYLLFYERIS